MTNVIYIKTPQIDFLGSLHFVGPRVEASTQASPCSRVLYLRLTFDTLNLITILFGTFTSLPSTFFTATEDLVPLYSNPCHSSAL